MFDQDKRDQYERARMLYDAGRFSAALAILDELERSFPNVRDLMYARALCFAATAKWDEAKILCNKLHLMHGDPRGLELRTQIQAHIKTLPSGIARATAPKRTMPPTSADSFSERPSSRDGGHRTRPGIPWAAYAAAVGALALLLVAALISLPESEETIPPPISTPPGFSVSNPSNRIAPDDPEDADAEPDAELGDLAEEEREPDASLDAEGADEDYPS